MLSRARPAKAQSAERIPALLVGLLLCGVSGSVTTSGPTTSALAQTASSLPQSHQAKSSDLSNSALELDWVTRVMANDPKVRAIAEAALVEGAERSLPLLRRFLNRRNEDLQLKTFEIIRRIGPPAIPLLVDLLRHEQVSIRRSAVDALIDLAPHTESIQPALRRALRDEDSDVAGDAARALGALGKRASP